MSAAQAEEHCEQVRDFIEGTSAAARGVTPICAQLGYNLGAVCAQIAALPTRPRKEASPPRMLLIRSFDVNRPGTVAAELNGGVLGGAVSEGVLRVGDELEVRPGILGRDERGELTCTP